MTLIYLLPVKMLLVKTVLYIKSISIIFKETGFHSAQTICLHVRHLYYLGTLEWLHLVVEMLTLI